MYIFNKFTDYANTSLNEAIAIASRLGHTFIGSEHLLYGLVIKETSVSSTLLAKKGIKRTDIYNKLIEHNGQGESLRLSPENFTPRLKKIIEYSMIQAQKLKHKQVGTEHLLLSILEQEDGYALVFFKELGVDIDVLYTDIVDDLMKLSGELKGYDETERQIRSNEKLKEVLKYGKDLTALARSKKLDPVLKRDKEIGRVLKTLARRTKNNPCLIGEAGVGKTAIIEGLAQLIQSGNVDESMKNKRIISIDIASVVAGAKYRGDFEERIKNIIDEVKENKNIILFIDEIHNIIGTGSSEGAMDAGNILKPSLARADIQIIGATTLDEYEKKIAKDSALERRFQKIQILPPDKETTKEILKGIKGKYEEYHKIKITDEVIDYTVNCADRYLKNRYFPDKAIDLIDEAGASLKVNNKNKLNDNRKIKLIEEKEEAFLKKDFVKLKQYKQQAKEMLNDDIGVNNSEDLFFRELTKSDIAKVLSEWTGILVDNITKDETTKLLEMESELKKKVIGQDNAIKIITKAVKRGRLGLSGDKKPIGSFLFLGTTGVGKTQLSKELTKILFDDECAMIRLDMSEYMEKHSVAKIIGAPPGYIGFEDGGYLTKMVRRKPYSVILFDEIEKAHNDVLSILLQILDDGRLTDTSGKVTDFRQCIIIMTSNIGASKLENTKKLGFCSSDNKYEDEKIKKDIILKELKKQFKPELLNRIDEVIIFNSLNIENISTIGKIYIKDIEKKMLSKGITLKVEDDFLLSLAKKSDFERYGARDLKRLIINEIENPLTDILLRDSNSLIEKICIGKNGIKVIKREYTDLCLLN